MYRRLALPGVTLLKRHFRAQLSEAAFVQGGLDRADWRKRKYMPPSVDEAIDANEASQFDEGRVSNAPVAVAATCVQRRMERSSSRTPRTLDMGCHECLCFAGFILPCVAE